MIARMGAVVELLTGVSMSSRGDVRHGFTTRFGGCSVGHLAELNLAMRPGETVDALRENWRRALAALGGSRETTDLALVHQVHGSRVVLVDAGAGPVEVVAEADATVALGAGVVLAIRTADCVPILLAGNGGVAAVHAGWRGVASQVVGRAVELLSAQLGCPASELTAVIGPHISVGAYEVGEEVVRGIESSGVPREVFVNAGAGRDHVDLGAAVERQLVIAGVLDVESIGACTYGDHRFFSHRRDGSGTGRQAGLITCIG